MIQYVNIKSSLYKQEHGRVSKAEQAAMRAGWREQFRGLPEDEQAYFKVADAGKQQHIQAQPAQAVELQHGQAAQSQTAIAAWTRSTMGSPQPASGLQEIIEEAFVPKMVGHFNRGNLGYPVSPEEVADYVTSCLRTKAGAEGVGDSGQSLPTEMWNHEGKTSIQKLEAVADTAFPEEGMEVLIEDIPAALPKVADSRNPCAGHLGCREKHFGYCEKRDGKNAARKMAIQNIAKRLEGVRPAAKAATATPLGRLPCIRLRALRGGDESADGGSDEGQGTSLYLLYIMSLRLVQTLPQQQVTLFARVSEPVGSQIQLLRKDNWHFDFMTSWMVATEITQGDCVTRVEVTQVNYAMTPELQMDTMLVKNIADPDEDEESE
jgi:hypothetical protein